MAARRLNKFKTQVRNPEPQGEPTRFVKLTGVFGMCRDGISRAIVMYAVGNTKKFVVQEQIGMSVTHTTERFDDRETAEYEMLRQAFVHGLITSLEM